MSEKNRILFSTKKQKTTKLLRSSKTNELTKGDAYFYKYWPANLSEFREKATLMERDFFDWLVQYKLRAKDNQIEGTYKDMAKDADVSLRFIEKAMRKLMDTDVIVKIRTGADMLNPNILFKGEFYARHEAQESYKYYKDQMSKQKKTR